MFDITLRLRIEIFHVDELFSDIVKLFDTPAHMVQIRETVNRTQDLIQQGHRTQINFVFDFAFHQSDAERLKILSVPALLEVVIHRRGRHLRDDCSLLVAGKKSVINGLMVPC
ncbi:MAG: hypothetical protein ACI9I0_001235 [Rhodoferax sp.]|jgi:hypothetical protein